MTKPEIVPPKSWAIDVEDFENATLRLESAEAMLTFLHSVFEGGTSRPGDEAIQSALSGVQTLVNDSRVMLNNSGRLV